jgi:glycosyltransferase involved in cell wall biosynthesis
MGQKGFRTLVDAMHEIVEKELVVPLPHVVTFGWGGFIREDYEYLEKKGLRDYFHQMPQTDNMPAALKGVDLVAMPSRWEACGLLAMETLAAGVPIVGTHCVGLREVLEGTPASVVAPSDSSALCRAVIEDLRNLEARKSGFIAFQKHAVEHFQISRPASELRKLYQQVYDESMGKSELASAG